MLYLEESRHLNGGSAQEPPFYRSISSTNKESCMDSCLADERCVVFSFWSFRESCYLKAAVKANYFVLCDFLCSILELSEGKYWGI